MREHTCIVDIVDIYLLVPVALPFISHFPDNQHSLTIVIRRLGPSFWVERNSHWRLCHQHLLHGSKCSCKFWVKCLKELPGLVFKTFCQGDSEGSRIASDNIRKLTGILFPHQTTLLSVLCISIIRSHQLNPTRIFCLCFLVLIRVREDFYRENFNFQYSILMFLKVQPK